MRNRRSIIGVVVAVLIAALTASIAWAAPGDTVQTITGQITPNKLPKKKWKNAAVNITTTVGVEGEDGQVDPSLRPPPATKALITFDKDIRFNSKGTPQCTKNLNDTSTAQARQRCGKSVIGGGEGEVAIASGANRFPAVITAFNGKKQGKNPTILLHSRVEGLGTTAILRGVLKGKKLDVTIPELAGGQGSVTSFQTKVKKGKFVQAKCPDKKFNYTGKFTYEDGSSKTVKDSQTCQGTGGRR